MLQDSVAFFYYMHKSGQYKFFRVKKPAPLLRGNKKQTGDCPGQAECSAGARQLRLFLASTGNAPRPDPYDDCSRNEKFGKNDRFPPDFPSEGKIEIMPGQKYREKYQIYGK